MTLTAGSRCNCAWWTFRPPIGRSNTTSSITWLTTGAGRRSNSRRPRIVTAPDAEGGRGLVLVAVPATAWGVDERAVGKTVWAKIPLTARKGTVR